MAVAEIHDAPGRLALLMRAGQSGDPIVACDLVGLTGPIDDNGGISLRGTVAGRPYRLAVGQDYTLDFALANLRRAGVLRCRATVTAYDHPSISISGKGITPSPVPSLTR